jgi:hypothetical protein
MVLFTKYNINNSLSLNANCYSYMNRISLCLFMVIKFVYFVPFRVREGMDVGVRSSNDIYDPIGQVGW